MKSQLSDLRLSSWTCHSDKRRNKRGNFYFSGKSKSDSGQSRRQQKEFYFSGRRRIDSGRSRRHNDAAGYGDEPDYQYPCPSIETKNLLTVFSGELGGGTWAEVNKLAYLSIPIEFLFCGSEGFFEKVYASQVYKAGIGMTCVRWKEYLFLIGGAKKHQLKVEEGNLIKDLRRFEIRGSELIGSSYSVMSPMHSGKKSPIVFVHNDLVYVLSRSAGYDGHYFECYDPCQDRWDILDSPPFYNEESPFYCDCPYSFSYALLDDRICVSIRSLKPVAFAYDILRKKWENCTLFDGVRVFNRLRTEFDIVGLPFHFDEEAIVVEEDGKKYLISTNVSSSVVAFEISSGRVIKGQILLPLPSKSEWGGDNIVFVSLASLGQHYYCLKYTEYHHGVTWLILLTFQASPKRDNEDPNNFFVVRVCNKCKIKFLEEDRVWIFAQTLAL